MRCVRFLIWGLGVLCVSAPAQSMAERVRLELSGPLVPYERIEYAIEHQHGAIVEYLEYSHLHQAANQ